MSLNGEYEKFKAVTLTYLKHCITWSVFRPAKNKLLIRFGFNRNTDPSFHLNVNADPDLESIEGKSMRIHSDPEPIVKHA
jgi:hypothetical protein